MNKKSMSLPVITAAFAAMALMSACDKRDAATPPMPQTAPSTTTPSTTSPSTTAPTTGGSMTPSDPAASAPSTGASN